ncbi:MAG: hypothetical protein CVU08_15325 [Bacteroidetes bacterium HGW-Bacteroidetes-3]|nr:MAG: hypothetical protein CVU08_15325 [Bacteroidetes bacterium HGW-Bacteroidetes-3]
MIFPSETRFFIAAKWCVCRIGVVTIYPNPASDSFKISTLEINDEITVQIFSISGQLVAQQKYFNEEINVSQLPNGVYLVKVTLSSGFQKTQKLIISR